MIVWLWIIRIVNSIASFILSIWVSIILFSSDNEKLSGMDTFHYISLTVILLLGFIFTLLVYPICSYLEKKLKD